MTFLVRKFIIFFLIFELIMFCVLYCFGPKGLSYVFHLKKEREQTVCAVAQLTSDIEDLKKNIAQNGTDFEKEKIAREKLLMKKEHEVVYFKTK